MSSNRWNIHEVICEKGKTHRFVYNACVGLEVLNKDDSTKDINRIPKSFWPAFDKWEKENVKR